MDTPTYDVTELTEPGVYESHRYPLADGYLAYIVTAEKTVHVGVLGATSYLYPVPADQNIEDSAPFRRLDLPSEPVPDTPAAKPAKKAKAAA